VLTVAACEAGLSLSIILSLYQRVRSLDVELWSKLKEADVEAGVTVDDQPPVEEPEMYFPTLTGAGAMPSMDDDAPLAAEVARARRTKAGSFRYGEPRPPQDGN
jgi:NADH-quinone oxidoreductase subunit K